MRSDRTHKSEIPVTFESWQKLDGDHNGLLSVAELSKGSKHELAAVLTEGVDWGKTAEMDAMLNLTRAPKLAAAKLFIALPDEKIAEVLPYLTTEAGSDSLVPSPQQKFFFERLFSKASKRAVDIAIRTQHVTNEQYGINNGVMLARLYNSLNSDGRDIFLEHLRSKDPDSLQLLKRELQEKTERSPQHQTEMPSEGHRSPATPPHDQRVIPFDQEEFPPDPSRSLTVI